MSISDLAVDNYCSSVELLKFCSANTVKAISITLEIQTTSNENKQLTFSHHENSISKLAEKLEAIHLEMLYLSRGKADNDE